TLTEIYSAICTLIACDKFIGLLPCVMRKAPECALLNSGDISDRYGETRKTQNGCESDVSHQSKYLRIVAQTRRTDRRP
ncbi:hypothetical protein, partial [Nostoc sp. UCD120]|uniref:hypothetical protein n=1 Tax=Nostoc sp. UCD120 TaxID=2681312 RepID=UPI001C890BFE